MDAEGVGRGETKGSSKASKAKSKDGGAETKHMGAILAVLLAGQ